MNHEIEAELQAFLAEGKVVSYKWLSITVSCNISVAASILSSYFGKNPNLDAKYLVSGTRRDSTPSFMIVGSKELEDTKALFNDGCFYQVYSLQECPSENSATQIFTSSMEQISHCLTHTNDESVLLNKLGNIKLHHVEIRPLGQRARAAMQAVPEIAAEKKNESTGEYINRMFANTSGSKASISKANATVQNFFGKMPSQSSRDKVKSTTEKTTHSDSADVVEQTADKISEKATKQNFFSKHATTASSNGKGKSKKSDAIVGADVEAIAENETEPDTKVAEEGEEDEWDDGTQYKTDKEKLKKRRKVYGDENSTAAGAETEETGEQDSSLSTNNELATEKKSHVQKHGAMDDFLEDAAEKENHDGILFTNALNSFTDAKNTATLSCIRYYAG